MVKAAFITGSRRYGKPKDDSDWDIVLRCDRKDAAAFGQRETWQGASGEVYTLDDKAHQFKLGAVNFILCFTDERFNSWRKGTDKLALISPVDRSVAVAMFKGLFAAESKEST